MEHQNELALKDQETERAIAGLREEFLKSSDFASSKSILLSINQAENCGLLISCTGQILQFS